MAKEIKILSDDKVEVIMQGHPICYLLPYLKTATPTAPMVTMDRIRFFMYFYI